ncbi:hypothetical protein GCK72_007130 [Caenorhabditis remanei]|uniref:Uncharacterized protein n=1 Tax=Caenorhabditis remanei TaxID=31234 RepID=A0A6A5HJ47_CAERE|nr:hypothetical protein GCK72_007130 [Caenorhabditis remanei]KAF1767171.1 hypothetical protein GCK72_007130 [Caenorhabditis remanei]
MDRQGNNDKKRERTGENIHQQQKKSQRKQTFEKEEWAAPSTSFRDSYQVPEVIESRRSLSQAPRSYFLPSLSNLRASALKSQALERSKAQGNSQKTSLLPNSASNPTALLLLDKRPVQINAEPEFFG